MIVAYFVFFIVAVVAFLLMAQFSLPMRIAAAFIIFMIPSIALTVWVVRVGDKAPPDAVTIVPEPTVNSKNSKPKDPE